jgi:phosphoribosylformylglycinamidine synthase
LPPSGALRPLHRCRRAAVGRRHQRLTGLLTYGEPAHADNTEGHAEEFFVIPRFGTISPWASKATDIVHNCGMAHIKRVERGVAFRINLKTGILGTCWARPRS